MKLPNYFQDPHALHIGTEPLRSYYIPTAGEGEAMWADMQSSSRVLELNGSDWKFKFYESYHQIPDYIVGEDIPVREVIEMLGLEQGLLMEIRELLLSL